MSMGFVEPQGWYGYRPNPAAVQADVASFQARYGRPAALRAAARDWMGDGMTGDFMNYLCWLELDIADWKKKGDYPPYINQPGNDCTAESTSRGVDQIQAIGAAQGQCAFSSVKDRTCIEYTYAAGLAVAGWHGDRGCYGQAMAQAMCETGALSYGAVGSPMEVDKGRLIQWANTPKSVVSKYGDQSKNFLIGERTQVQSWEEFCAIIANQGVVLLASSIGFNGDRDQAGIIRRRGVWPHQMVGVAVIRSDGTETGVIKNSWGQDFWKGPRPFQLPGDCFRAIRIDIEAILNQGDCWGLTRFPGFEKTPVPEKWTYNVMA